MVGVKFMGRSIFRKWGTLVIIAGAILIASGFAAPAAFGILILRHDLPVAPGRAESLGEWLDYLPFWHERQLRAAVDEAWEQSDWASAITLLSDLRAVDPSDSSISSRLGTAHFLYAEQLVQIDEFRAALLQFQAARALLPGDADVARSYNLISEYQAGLDS
jgi:hypothetical protein